MIKKLFGIVIITAVAALLLLISRTTPVQAGPLGILMVFFCFYIIIVGGITVCIWAGSRVLARLYKLVAARRPFEAVSVERAYYLSTIIGLAPIILIAMQSVGEVSFYELLLVVLFVAIGCVYISKRTP